MEDLVNTAGMRAHIGPKFSRAIHELFHPLPKKVIETSVAPAPAPPRERPTLPQLKAKAEEFIWQTIRDIPFVEFWKADTWQNVTTGAFRKYLDVGADDGHPLYDIAQAAVARVNEKARTFSVSITGNQYRQSVETLKIQLQPNGEWRDVMKEAWSKVENPPPRLLSSPALQLYAWLKDSAFPEEWMSDRALSWKAGLFGKLGVVGDHLWELRRKVGEAFCFESRGHRWDEKLEYRIWIEGEVSLDGPAPARNAPGALNPIMTVNFEECGKKEFDHWRNFIQEHLLKSRPSGQAPVQMIWIESRNELRRIFPKLVVERFGTAQNLVEFWTRVSPHPDIITKYDFRDTAEAWHVNLQPKASWESVLEAMAQLAEQPTLKDKYGLSSDAAKLLEWIEQLRPENFEGNWTPIVENKNEKHIGLDCPWDKENFSSYLQLLVEEINEKTACDLRLQPWKEDSRTKTRIRVAKKLSDENELVRQIQLYALQKGRILDAKTASEALRTVVDSHPGTPP